MFRWYFIFKRESCFILRPSISFLIILENLIKSYIGSFTEKHNYNYPDGSTAPVLNFSLFHCKYFY
jgi:hypothetical protein